MSYLSILREIGSDAAVADTVGVSRQTIFAWRTGRRSPKATDVYRVAIAYQLRPETFAQTERMILLNMRQDAGNVTPAAVGRWVRSRVAQCRAMHDDDFVDDIGHIARRASMDRRTALRIMSEDDVQWEFLMRFIMNGLGVHPFALISPGPVPHARRVFSRIHAQSLV